MASSYITARLSQLANASTQEMIDEVPSLRPGDESKKVIVQKSGVKFDIVDGQRRIAGMLRWAKENNVEARELSVSVVTSDDEDLLSQASEPGPDQKEAIEKIYAGVDKDPGDESEDEVKKIDLDDDDSDDESSVPSNSSPALTDPDSSSSRPVADANADLDIKFDPDKSANIANVVRSTIKESLSKDGGNSSSPSSRPSASMKFGEDRHSITSASETPGHEAGIPRAYQYQERSRNFPEVTPSQMKSPENENDDSDSTRGNPSDFNFCQSAMSSPKNVPSQIVNQNSTHNTYVCMQSPLSRQVASTAMQQRSNDIKQHEERHSAALREVDPNAKPEYKQERGPDGRQYVVSGEVNTDTLPIHGNVAATKAKADVVYQSAMQDGKRSKEDNQVARQALDMRQGANVSASVSMKSDANKSETAWEFKMREIKRDKKITEQAVKFKQGGGTGPLINAFSGDSTSSPLKPEYEKQPGTGRKKEPKQDKKNAQNGSGWFGAMVSGIVSGKKEQPAQAKEPRKQLTREEKIELRKKTHATTQEPKQQEIANEKKPHTDPNIGTAGWFGALFRPRKNMSMADKIEAVKLGKVARNFGVENVIQGPQAHNAVVAAKIAANNIPQQEAILGAEKPEELKPQPEAVAKNEDDRPMADLSGKDIPQADKAALDQQNQAHQQQVNQQPKQAEKPKPPKTPQEWYARFNPKAAEFREKNATPEGAAEDWKDRNPIATQYHADEAASKGRGWERLNPIAMEHQNARTPEEQHAFWKKRNPIAAAYKEAHSGSWDGDTWIHPNSGQSPQANQKPKEVPKQNSQTNNDSGKFNSDFIANNQAKPDYSDVSLQQSNPLTGSNGGGSNSGFASNDSSSLMRSSGSQSGGGTGGESSGFDSVVNEIKSMRELTGDSIAVLEKIGMMIEKSNNSQQYVSNTIGGGLPSIEIQDIGDVFGDDGGGVVFGMPVPIMQPLPFMSIS